MTLAAPCLGGPGRQLCPPCHFLALLPCLQRRYLKHKRDDGPEKQEDEAVDVTPIMICVFVVMCCGMLVLLYYFYDQLGACNTAPDTSPAPSNTYLVIASPTPGHRLHPLQHAQPLVTGPALFQQSPTLIAGPAHPNTPRPGTQVSTPTPANPSPGETPLALPPPLGKRNPIHCLPHSLCHHWHLLPGFLHRPLQLPGAPCPAAALLQVPVSARGRGAPLRPPSQEEPFSSWGQPGSWQPEQGGVVGALRLPISFVDQDRGGGPTAEGWALAS